MKNDGFYLSYILEAISRIEEYTIHGRNEFMRSTLLQDAVIRNLEVIGEATKSVSAMLREAHKDVPWKSMAGLRDVLIHEYFQINLDIVWNVASRELPKVKVSLQGILDSLE